MIFLTGDTHFNHDIHKLTSSNFVQGKKLTKKDYVIILGDFGLLWYNDSNNSEEKYWKKWLSQKPWTTLFVDGNHENHSRLLALPMVEKFGGNVGVVNDSIFHLKRGEIYEINHEVFFTMGGAYSIDKANRQEGISWWKEEQPSYAEYEYGLSNLEKYNWKVDYILAHNCPRIVTEEYLTTMGLGMGNGLIKTEFDYYVEKMDSIAKYFDEVVKKTKFKKFYYGHFHDEWTSKDEKYVMLYNNIVPLGANYLGMY